jgi:hypothetical protein
MVSQEGGLAVPAMYTTGAEDKLVRPAVVEASFERSVNASPRVFAELADADHFEPTNPRDGHRRLNPYVAAFLLCHVAEDDGSCAKIYDAGDSSSLCNAYSDEMAGPDGACQIVQEP